GEISMVENDRASTRLRPRNRDPDRESRRWCEIVSWGACIGQGGIIASRGESRSSGVEDGAGGFRRV
ncbi:hypothetical protein Drorol1_Dr00009044, partial [Drosera rotundifolia]